jgi:hypothetical protein
MCFRCVDEYLIDGTIQRVDAKEYLYGEVHKGFYESLFPDPLPLDETKHAGVNRTNPFQTIMETIFAVAEKLREKHGKPVNLWMTGHSLGKQARRCCVLVRVGSFYHRPEFHVRN